MGGQDVMATPESAELAKQGEDSEVDLGHKRQAARKEVHHRGRSGLVELEQSLQVDLVMLVQQLLLFAG